MIRFTKRFRARLGVEAEVLVERIYRDYFADLIEGDVTVSHTSSKGVWGRADPRSNTVLLRRADKHTIAHELMHLAQRCPKNSIPSGERACDLYTDALDPELAERSFYIKTWGAPPSLVWRTCREALQLRRVGLRNYIKYAEGRLKALMAQEEAHHAHA